MFITIFGMDALSVAQDANLQPEVLVGSVWRLAKSFAEARALLATEPNLVRLRGDLRVLLENILKTAVLPGESLPAIMTTALTHGLGLTSIPIIQRLIP